MIIKGHLYYIALTKSYSKDTEKLLVVERFT